MAEPTEAPAAATEDAAPAAPPSPAAEASATPAESRTDTRAGTPCSRRQGSAARRINPVEEDTTITHSEISEDGVQVTYIHSIQPGRMVITKETVIPTDDNDPTLNDFRTKASELLDITTAIDDPGYDLPEIDSNNALNATMVVENPAFSTEELPEPGGFPPLKPLPKRALPPRKHAAGCAGGCGGKCLSAKGAGSARSAGAARGAATAARRPGTAPPQQRLRPVSSTKSMASSRGPSRQPAGPAPTTRGRPARGGQVGQGRGATSDDRFKRPVGRPGRGGGTRSRGRGGGRPVAVVETTTQKSRTIVMNPRALQQQKRAWASTHIPQHRQLQPYYGPSLPPGMNPAELLDYAMDQILPECLFEPGNEGTERADMMKYAMEQIEVPAFMTEPGEEDPEVDLYGIDPALRDSELYTFPASPPRWAGAHLTETWEPGHSPPGWLNEPTYMPQQRPPTDLPLPWCDQHESRRPRWQTNVCPTYDFDATELPIWAQDVEREEEERSFSPMSSPRSAPMAAPMSAPLSAPLPALVPAPAPPRTPPSTPTGRTRGERRRQLRRPISGPSWAERMENADEWSAMDSEQAMALPPEDTVASQCSPCNDR